MPSTFTETNARTALNLIHAIMSVPFEWSSDTIDAVATVLAAIGYEFPDEDDSARLYDQYGKGVVEDLVTALAPWHPATV